MLFLVFPLSARDCSFGGMTGITNVGEIMLHSTARLQGHGKKQELGQVPGTTVRKERAHGTSLDQDHLGLAGALIHCPSHPHTKPKAYFLILFRSPCTSIERRVHRPSSGENSNIIPHAASINLLFENK